jgi:hypothetical protein
VPCHTSPLCDHTLPCPEAGPEEIWLSGGEAQCEGWLCPPQGRFTIAAKHHISIAEIYETELVDIEKVSRCRASFPPGTYSAGRVG